MLIIFISIVFISFILLTIFRKKRYYNQEPFKNIWDKTYLKDRNSMLLIINNIYTICKSNNITLIPINCTLLGIIKFNDFLPWYSSFDICISDEDLCTLKNLLVDSSLGIVYTNNKLKIHKKDVIWPYICIYTFKVYNNKIVLQNENLRYAIKNEYIYPLHDYVFNNITITIPNSIEKILNIIYKKDWKKYCESSDYDHKMEKRYCNSWNVEWVSLNCIPTSITFEHTYVINLEREKNRWRKTRRNLQKIGIEPKKWVATDKKSTEVKGVYDDLGFKFGINLGTIACYLSHKKLWEYLYLIDVPYAFIFEDDIIIGKNITTQCISKIVKNSIGFNIIFLGYTNQTRNLEFNNCSKEGGGSCLHAYVVSRHGLKNLLNLKHDFLKPIDKLTSDFSNDFLCYLAKNTKNNGNFGNGIVFQDINLESDLRFRFKIFGKIVSF